MCLNVAVSERSPTACDTRMGASSTAPDHAFIVCMQATWSKGTTVSVDLAIDFDKSVGYCFEGSGFGGITVAHELETGFNFLGLTGGVSWKAVGATTTHGGGGDEGGHKGRALSRGNALSLTAVASYSTSDDPAMAGAASDLFITPSLSIRLLSVLPITIGPDQTFFCANGASAMEIHKTWQILEMPAYTSDNDLYDKDILAKAETNSLPESMQYELYNRNIGQFEGVELSLKQKMQQAAERATEEDTWNAGKSSGSRSRRGVIGRVWSAQECQAWGVVVDRAQLRKSGL